MITLQQTGGHGILLPDYGIGLDGGSAETPYLFVSHAHADHVPRSRQASVYATPATSRLMQQRGFNGTVNQLDFYQPLETGHCKITFYPAGHILGSAMIYIETDEGSLLYSGDCRTPPSPVSEGFDHPENIDYLIVEATFGLPIYRWHDHETLFRSIRKFAQETLDEESTPVFFCYNLGKAQEVMHALAPLNHRIQIHGGGFPLCEIYEDFGFDLGPYEPYNRETVSGSILVTPPTSRNSGMLNHIDSVRTAWVSGWAATDTNPRLSGTDQLIPLSDHLDFFELIDWCKQLQPRHVYITHTPNPEVVLHYLAGEGISASFFSDQ